MKNIKNIFIICIILFSRFFGLFIIYPLFSLFLQEFHCKNNFFVGLALGIYGLSQALFQIPFGIISDFYNRKKIIVIGIVIFIAGNYICYISHSIGIFILGRFIQGTSALGSMMMSLLYDSIEDDYRLIASSCVGFSAGISFILSIVFSHILVLKLCNINSLFLLNIIISCFHIPLLCLIKTEKKKENFIFISINFLKNIMLNKNIFSLLIRICCVHIVFTSLFIIIPLLLQSYVNNKNYIPYLYIKIFFLSYLITTLILLINKNIKKYCLLFFISYMLIIISIIFMFIKKIQISLILFFSGINILESKISVSILKNSLVKNIKGTIISIYSTYKFIGMFLGGIIGGYIFHNYYYNGVLIFSLIIILFPIFLEYFFNI